MRASDPDLDMSYLRTLCTLTITALLAVACADEEPADSTTDASVDAVSDTTDGDTETDTASDSGTDAVSDTGEDATPEDTGDDATDEDATAEDTGDDVTPEDTGDDTTPEDTGDDATTGDTSEDTTTGDAGDDAATDDAGDDATTDDTGDDATTGDTGDDVGELPTTCPDLIAAVEAELDAVRTCTQALECGQVMTGTSCGCTRNLVARIDADLARFEALREAIFANSCDWWLGSTCDCPEADGYACVEGLCTWNYL